MAFKILTLDRLQYFCGKMKAYVDTKVTGAVSYATSQGLTDAQKAQARTNIGAGTSSLTESDVNTLIDNKLGDVETLLAAL